MKKVLVGILLLVILMGITVWVTQQDQGSTMRKELIDFAVTDTASVTRVVLKDEQGTKITLDRIAGGWQVNERYAARPDAVEILLRTMRKLAVKAPIGESMKSTVLKNIIAKHTLVEVYEGDALTKTFYVGGPDREHTGTFMMMKGSSRPFLMHLEGFHGFLTTRFFTNVNEWRQRVVYEYAPEEILEVSIKYTETPDKNFTIRRAERNGFEVYTGLDEQQATGVDTFMLNAYLSRFDMVHFEGFEETKTASYIDSVLQNEPIFEISLTDKEGQTTTATGYRKPLSEGYDIEGNPINFDQDRLYLKVNDEKVVVAQYAIFDKLTKRIGFLKNR